MKIPTKMLPTAQLHYKLVKPLQHSLMSFEWQAASRFASQLFVLLSLAPGLPQSEKTGQVKQLTG